jgi:L-gulonolactone oxidase
MELRDWLDGEHSDPDGLRPHFPIEIRFSDADDIWLSPSSGQRTCWIGLIQYKSVALHDFLQVSPLTLDRPYGFNVPYRKLFQRFETIVSRHTGRPHWAKAHHLRPQALRKLYPHFDDFVRVLEDHDPQGRFRNEYVTRHIFGGVGSRVDERVFKPPL